MVETENTEDKAITVFKYFTAPETTKTGWGDFKTTLENIERYLDSNDGYLLDVGCLV